MSKPRLDDARYTPRGTPHARRLARGIAVLAAALALGPARDSAAQARAPVPAMEKSTVRIELLLLETATQQIRAIGNGSGFMLEQNHVATNAHVADPAFILETMPQEAKEVLAPRLASGELRVVPVVRLGAKEAVTTSLVWSSRERDLAVLRLERAIDRPPVVFARETHVESGDEVIAIGFPAAADLGSLDDVIVPTVTRGTLSRLTTGQGGTKQYQIDAAINSGNSGGPLFNVCGQVIGINVQKATSQVRGGEQLAVNEGLGWSIRADELLGALDRLKVPYKAAGERCASVATAVAPVADPWLQPPVVVSLVVGVIALVVSTTRRGRQVVAERARTAADTIGLRRRAPADPKGPSAPPPLPPPVPPPAGPALRPTLVGVDGPYKGSVVELGETPLTIGRDPRVSQLVLPADAVAVSKRHCILAFDRVSRTFTVEDCWSANGTFAGSGERLTPGAPRTFQAGERFAVGDPHNAFELRVEWRQS